MKPYYADDAVTVLAGDCLEVLRTLPDCSIEAVVTDPPYGLRFMGRAWDGADIMAATSTRRQQAAMPDDGRSGAEGGYRSASTEAGRYDLSANAAFGLWCTEWATECLRVLKPGGHLLAFGGSRTWHRLACAVEDAGFEIRDSIAWLYGSGFPKSLDVSKAVDKMVDTTASRLGFAGETYGGTGASRDVDLTVANTPEAAAWRGWGTALKPAFEPIVVARKPLSGTVAANVLAHGTGALNIDACRIGYASPADEAESKGKNRHGDFGTLPGGNEVYGDYSMVERTNYDPPGRWPTNVLLDESQADALDAQSGDRGSSGIYSGDGTRRPGERSTDFGGTHRPASMYGDAGGASRFFPIFRYEAKAGSDERPRVNGVAHPTVKPLALIRWCARLITPPGGTVLDLFGGSGTTAEACVIEGFRCIIIEREADYLPLIVSRLTKPIEPTLDFSGGAA